VAAPFGAAIAEKEDIRRATIPPMSHGEEQANPYEPPKSVDREEDRKRVPLWRVSTFGFSIVVLFSPVVGLAIAVIIILLTSTYEKSSPRNSIAPRPKIRTPRSDSPTMSPSSTFSSGDNDALDISPS
jgi:hypothetical protein